MPVKGLGQNNAMGIRLVNRSPWKVDGSGEGGPEERAAQGGLGGLSVFRTVAAPQSLEEYVQDKRSALGKQDLCSNHAGSPRLRLAFKVSVFPLSLFLLSLCPSLQHVSSFRRARSLRPRGERALRCSPKCLSSVYVTFSATHSPVGPLASTALPSPSLPPPASRSPPFSPPLPPYVSLVRLYSCLLLSAGRIAMSSAADAADQKGRQSDIWILPQILGIRGTGAGFAPENVRERGAENVSTHTRNAQSCNTETPPRFLIIKSLQY